MANISEFKSRLAGGGARANQFRAYLFFPNFVSGGGTAAEQAQFLCNSAQLPSSTIDPITVLYRGRPINFAGERTFQPWTVSIYNDTNFQIRNALETWSDGIQNVDATTGVTNPLDYQVDLQVQQLDRNGAVIKVYTFVDAFPTEVGDIALGYDQGNAIETFNVTFLYNFWVSDTSTGFVVPTSSAVNGGPI
jgi:hypothetical protein